MTNLAMAIAVWCAADHSPYKSVAICEREIRECVKDNKNWEKCFVVPEDLTDWGDTWVK